MAGLFDRIATNPDSESPQISGHYLIALVIAYFNGKYTADQIKTFFNMDPGCQSDFDGLIAHFDGLASNTAKIGFLQLLEAATVLIELGGITDQTEYLTFLGVI